MNNALFVYCKMNSLLNEGKKRVKEFYKKKGQSGMGTVEIIIIIAVLVALALLFKTFIMDLAEDIFEKIQTKTDSAINDL